MNYSARQIYTPTPSIIFDHNKKAGFEGPDNSIGLNSNLMQYILRVRPMLAVNSKPIYRLHYTITLVNVRQFIHSNNNCIRLNYYLIDLPLFIIT